MNLYKKGKKNVKYEMNNSKSFHNKESRAYNILSIDGGGICDVLPALWLSEIEYRTHRPISYLFDMITGTSTRGFIAAGLSVLSWKSYNTRNHLFYDDLKYSVLNPKFSALDLLNIYQSEIKNFFTTDSSWSFSKPKYTDEGRRSLFYRHFDGMYLNQALTELVIPAVNNLAQTHLFTRHDAIKNIKNYTFVDALMATTAAPTFFPSYKIEGRGIFLDGALHLNNPAMAAYEKANQYNVEKEKISVLSLGTGSYISDSLNTDLYKGQLFWAQNLHKAVLPQQEGNTDCLMYSLLENRYQRWQIWFEEPIRLDNYESIPNLLELGHQYIEELDASDENPINKLVESFEILST
ncbi:acyl transferase/acyl hydrolase/lysophospholipase [Rhizophagus diaphanus]|nr:acyl transferase/acyl hydrolase/lysophospholipase [Rhizophagus diaphanus] [Rhizophagus sp. MUCL 43196]